MTLTLPHHGAAQVGRIDTLPALDQLAVLCLRGLGRGSALRDFLAARFGAAAAASILARCDDLAQFLAREARRSLKRHAPGCTGLGADEALFAHLCRLADLGERDEILMFSMVLCRADLAPCLVPLAEMFVLSLKQALASSMPAGCPFGGAHHGQRLH